MGTGAPDNFGGDYNRRHKIRRQGSREQEARRQGNPKPWEPLMNADEHGWNDDQAPALDGFVLVAVRDDL
jgi:hypothetical protein